MASIQVVTVSLPRVVEGVLPRARGQGTPHAVWDDVPLALSSFDADEAPLALRRRHHDPRQAGTEWREREGRLYSPLMPIPVEAHKRRRRPLDPLGPNDLPAYVAADIRAALASRGPPGDRDRQLLGNWYRPLSKLPFPGKALEASPEIRVTGDDGRAAQSALRSRLEENLIVVGGVLHHRAVPPLVTVHASSSDVRAHETPGPSWPLSDRPPDRGWNDFPPHMAAHAEMYGRHQAAEAGVGYHRAGFWDMEIVDADALSRAYRGSSRVTIDLCTAALADRMADSLRHFGDDEVMAWLRLRAGGREAAETCADIDAIRLACEAYPDQPSEGAPENFWRIRNRIVEILTLSRGVLGRLSFEHGHGVLINAEDTAALEGIGM